MTSNNLPADITSTLSARTETDGFGAFKTITQPVVGSAVYTVSNLKTFPSGRATIYCAVENYITNKVYNLHSIVYRE